MASPVDTSVKFFTDEMVGAPTISGTAGALISVLDACLVNGFGSKTATGVTVAGGIATVTFPGGASAATAQAVILVAGATGSWTDLNGEQKVLSANTTTVTFATALADGTATGTITFKIAPLGWTKVYTGTNKAVYKPSAVEASSALLRVDDSGTTSARVRMYETMSDVDTGTNPAPTDAKVNGGLYWWKSNADDSTATKYAIVGDGRFLYPCMAPYQTGATGPVAVVHAFGDLVSYKSGDAYCAVLFGETAVTTTNTTGSASTGGANVSVQVMRAHTGIGTSTDAERKPLVGVASGVSGFDSTLGWFPNPANNGLFLTRMVVGVNPIASNGVRGLLPGLLYVPQSGTSGGTFPRGTIVDGGGEFTGKKMYAVPQAANSLSSAGSDHAAFFDVTGPWGT